MGSVRVVSVKLRRFEESISSGRFNPLLSLSP